MNLDLDDAPKPKVEGGTVKGLDKEIGIMSARSARAARNVLVGDVKR